MSDKKESLIERLENDVVLVAEGYIFELERRGYLKAGPFVPEVVLEYPGAVKELHHEFLMAGSDVIVACTYYAHRSKLKAIDKEDRLEELNLKSISLAQEVAQKGNALVAGNLSNTWEFNHNDPTESGKIVKSIFKEQVEWASRGNVDFIIAETFSHLGEASIALEVIKDAGFPAVITFTTVHEKSCDGYSWEESCRILEVNGADVVGFNCGRGPETLMPIVHRVRDKVQGHMAVLPVPYRTTPKEPCFFDLRLENSKNAFPVALDPFLLTRFEMADFTVKVRDIGVNYIGICCGAGPHHVRSMAEALGRKVPSGEYSPDINLHPVFGDQDIKKQHYVECLLGPNVSIDLNTT
ncbi:MAG: homocysteine S-methyltransferase family protein [Desulfobacterales bacterium]|nr:MAG: homocysteine S-methyltransferase family protein [Desulfobacterales bacterium]